MRHLHLYCFLIVGGGGGGGVKTKGEPKAGAGFLTNYQPKSYWRGRVR